MQIYWKALARRRGSRLLRRGPKLESREEFAQAAGTATQFNKGTTL
jgi:hypothetical protein